MTAPIILPPLTAAHLDLIWFGVIADRAEPFRDKSVAPDIGCGTSSWGVMPFLALMILSVIILCIFPEIATWFATAVMG